MKNECPFCKFLEKEKPPEFFIDVVKEHYFDLESVTQIAKRLKLNQRTLYHYFRKYNLPMRNRKDQVKIVKGRDKK